MPRSSIKKITAAVLGCAAAFGAISAVIWSYTDTQGLWNFWSGPAAGWVQAVGSIAAIMASFELGQRSFKNQVRRENIAHLERKRHAYMLLQKVFAYAEGIDTTAASPLQNASDWNGIGAAANDVLALVDAIPIMEIPDADLFARLTLARQAMIAYQQFSSHVSDLKPLSNQILQQWCEYAKTAEATSKAASSHCRQEIARIEKLIAAQQ